MGISRFVTGLREAGSRVFGIDVRALAAFRIGVGLILLGDLLVRAQYLTAHYTDFGVLPRSARMLLYDAGGGSRYWWSLHMFSGRADAQVVLFLVAAWFAGWLLIGYRTQLATIVSWLLLTSLHSRNPVLLQGGDTMLRCLLFWAMFLPLGATWSVDQAAGGKRRSEKRVFTAATVAILLQVAMVYWCTAAYKMQRSMWTQDYSAVYYALHCEQFATLFGQWLRQFPMPLAVLTFLTLWVEALGPLLAFSPIATNKIRTVIVFVFWACHLGLLLCLELGPFPYVAMVAWLLFLPSAFWDEAARWQSMLALRRLSRRLLLFLRYRARRLPYPRIAGWFPKPDQASLRLGWLPTIIVFTLLVYLGCWHVRRIKPQCWLSRQVPHRYDFVIHALRLDQTWRMFRGVPRSGWYLMRGTLRNGTTVNLFLPDRTASTAKPMLPSSLFPNQRWRKYLMNVNGRGYQRHRKYLSDWLRWRWDREHAGTAPGRRVRTVEILFFWESTPPPGKTGRRDGHSVLWRWNYS